MNQKAHRVLISLVLTLHHNLRIIQLERDGGRKGMESRSWEFPPLLKYGDKEGNLLSSPKHICKIYSKCYIIQKKHLSIALFVIQKIIIKPLSKISL